MNDVAYKTRALTNEILESEDYIQYRRLQHNIAEDQELYRKINEFRRKSFEIQNKEDNSNLFNELEALRKEYNSILEIGLVIDFFGAEQKICNLMRNVYDTIAETLEFDIEFLDK